MSKEKTMNMTEGSPVKLLVMFAIPMMLGNIFQQLYNVVDSAIVGRLVGADALAAVGATGSVTFLFFALLNGIVEVIGRFTVPIAMTMIPAIGLWGIWWSVGIVWFVSSFTAWLRYLWMKRKMINLTEL